MKEAPSSQAEPNVTPPAVLTVDELADLLRVNRDTAYRAIEEGQVPGVRRIGRVIRISRDAVLDWLRGKDHAPRSGRGKT